MIETYHALFVVPSDGPAAAFVGNAEAGQINLLQRIVTDSGSGSAARQRGQPRRSPSDCVSHNGYGAIASSCTSIDSKPGSPIIDILGMTHRDRLKTVDGPISGSGCRVTLHERLKLFRRVCSTLFKYVARPNP